MSRNFEISSDSTCDLYYDEINSLNISIAPLSYVLSKDDEIYDEVDAYKAYSEYEYFYDRLKKGFTSKTSMLNYDANYELFMGMASRGIKKAIHFSLSSGLSPTVENAVKAIEQVKLTYPDIKYLVVDSLTTTIGQGMLIKATVKMRDEGWELESAYEKIEEIKHFTQHFILANDLKFLARGGRISRISAELGSLFQVKPIIEFDKTGKLKVCRKEIGLNKALKSIVDDFSRFSLNADFPLIQIVHTGNYPLAEKLQQEFKTRFDIEPEIRIMGPVIGSHVGPGGVAYAFISNEERLY